MAVVKPTRGDADGLLLGLGEALSRIGIENIHSPNSVLGVDKMPVLIGAGTDGASVNVGAHGGMKGKLQSDLPWLFWSYQNSPKKSQELASIVSDLKEVFSLPKGGALPVRCQGTRWITHKRKALQRVIDRFGAYIAHLTTLSQDSSVKAVDRARIQGYLKQWSRTKMLIGSAMYIEILKAPSMLSLTLQCDNLDIIEGINPIVKSVDTLMSLSEQDPLQWPQVKLLLTKVNDEGVYQGCALNQYSSKSLDQCSAHAKADLARLDTKMRERLQWSDMKLLRSILVFLDTRSWVSHGTNRSSQPLTT